MQYNRMLRISTAGSRKAMRWPKSSILWSEFTEKLKMPVRGTEMPMKTEDPDEPAG